MPLKMSLYRNIMWAFSKPDICPGPRRLERTGSLQQNQAPVTESSGQLSPNTADHFQKTRAKPKGHTPVPLFTTFLLPRSAR